MSPCSVCLQTASYARAGGRWVFSHPLLSHSPGSCSRTASAGTPQALNNQDHTVQITLDCVCNRAHIQPLPSSILLCLNPMLEKKQEQHMSDHTRFIR